MVFRRRGSASVRRHRDALAYYESLDRYDWRYRWKSRRMWNQRVRSLERLPNFGPESLPYAIELLRSRNLSAREDGAWLLGAIGSQPGVVELLLEAVAGEEELVVLDTAVMALGDLRDERAVPVLAGLLRDPGTDGDTLSLVVESLGKIARRRFRSKEDALAWLAPRGS